MSLHPAAWISWAGCAALVAFSSTNPFYLVLLVAACWFVYSGHRLPGPAGRSFRIFLLFALAAVTIRTALVLFDTVNLPTIYYSALEGARLGALLVVFGTFNSVADPFGILRLAPRRFHEPALAAALALSIAPRTIDAVGRVREAQALRGISLSRWRSLPALAVPILESGMEEAVTLAESMDSRGHGRGRRSRYRPQAWNMAARVTVVAGAIAAGAYVVAGMLGEGMLNPPTDPIVWPQVSLALVAAGLLVAVPGLFPSRGEPS